eukprot:3825193-Rhodomonas_salina.1
MSRLCVYVCVCGPAGVAAGPGAVHGGMRRGTRAPERQVRGLAGGAGYVLQAAHRAHRHAASGVRRGAVDRAVDVTWTVVLIVVVVVVVDRCCCCCSRCGRGRGRVGTDTAENDDNVRVLPEQPDRVPLHGRLRAPELAGHAPHLPARLRAAHPERTVRRLYRSRRQDDEAPVARAPRPPQGLC